MGKKVANKPKSQTKRQQLTQHKNNNNHKPGKVNKKNTRHQVVKVCLSPGTSNMAKLNLQAVKQSGNKKLKAFLQHNFQKIKDNNIKTPKRLKGLPKTKRKLDFKGELKGATPVKPLRNLPKPKFYRPSERCSSSNKFKNETIEDGEIVEELDSSCDDDCVIVSVDIHNKDNSLKEQEKLDDNASDKLENNVDKLLILEDNKRNAQLLLKPQSENGLLYSTLNKTDEPAHTDTIITIDDSFDIPNSTGTLNNSIMNDSVIILEDYIPLSTGEPAPSEAVKPVKKRDPIKRSRMNDSLFTMSERKKICVYNSNTFNPTEDESETENPKEIGPINHKRSIVIDGSNVAFGHGNSVLFSAEGIKYCLQYFEKMGHMVKAVVPLFRKNPTKSSNPDLIDRLYKEGKIVFTPCKNLPGQMSSSYDDRFILQIAYEWNAAIVSNDNYRDLINENAAFKKIIENRVIGYSWCNNMFILAKDPYGRWGPQLDEILRC